MDCNPSADTGSAASSGPNPNPNPDTGAGQGTSANPNSDSAPHLNPTHGAVPEIGEAETSEARAEADAALIARQARLEVAARRRARAAQRAERWLMQKTVAAANLGYLRGEGPTQVWQSLALQGVGQDRDMSGGALRAV